MSGTVNYMQLANRLIQLGERAHSFRQFDRVREVGLLLSNIPVKHYQAIGCYFLAVAANSKGNGDQDEARRLFQLAVDTAPDSYKVKAIVSLGTLAIRRNDLDSASHHFQETIRTEKLSTASLQAIRGMSVLKSIEGFHESAIADVEGILPLVRFAPLRVRLNCLNSYAVELSEVGRLQEAESISSLVIASPLARYYPEWQETLSDVRSKRKRRSTVTISRPHVERSANEFGESSKARQPYWSQPGESSRLREPHQDKAEVAENALQAARIQTVIDFMNTNLERRVSVSELANAVNLSPSHLSRLFNLQTGLSPGEYLIRLRMEKARHCLATSSLSIKQVMATVGYDIRSRSNFVRQFKSYFDLTPSEYRRRFFTGIDTPVEG